MNRTGVRSGRSTAAWALTGTASFLAGQSSCTITINVRGDILQERDESFAVILSAPTGAALTTATATGTILNDDLIGDATANTLVGKALVEFIDGGANVVSLTASGAADVFGFRFDESPLNAPGVITDFAFGVDKINLFSASGAALAAPTRFSRAANNASPTSLGALAAAVLPMQMVLCLESRPLVRRALGWCSSPTLFYLQAR